MKNNMLPPPLSKSLNCLHKSYYRIERVLLSFTLLVLFAVMPFGKVKGQSACAGSIDIYSCAENVTLYSNAMGGYTYNWYDDHCAPGTLCSAPTYLSTGKTYTDIYSDGEYYFHYNATNGGGTCSSGSIHLVVALGFDITPTSGSFPLTMSLDVVSNSNVALMNYTNFQWYRNGIAISGATYSSYIATIAGDYYLEGYSSFCGNRTSSTVNLGCGLSNTYTANYIFPPGTTSLSNTTVVLDGTILVSPDAIVIMSNCDVIMKSGAEIIVQKADPGLGQSNGGWLTTYNTRFSSCDKWGGIYAEGYDNTTVNNPYSAKISITYSEIHDAYVGLYADNNAILTLSYNVFENNYQHIDLRSFSGEESGCSGGGNQGVNLEIHHTLFSYLMETVPGFTPLNLPTTPNNSSCRKMIYMDDCKTIKLAEDKFVCLNWHTAFDQNAVEVYNVSPELCLVSGFEIDQCHFAGDFNDAMYFSHVEDLYLYQCSVLGNVNHGIEVFDGDRVTIYICGVINTASQGGVSAINLSQVNHLILTNDSTWSFLKGIEYYNYTNNCVGLIAENDIQNNKYGLVIAPECDPTATSLACSNSNNYTNLRRLEYSCNKIFNNDWGIAGVGDIDPQGGSGTTEWENFFDYSAGYTTNTYADIAWYKTGSNADIYYYSTYLPQWNSNTIILDGHTVSNGVANKVTMHNSGSAGGCRGTFKPDPTIFPKAKDPIKNNSINIFPNPANDYMVLENNYEIVMGFDLLDMTGKQVMTGNVKGKSRPSLDISKLPSGCYLLSVYNHNNGETIVSQKVIKTY